VPRDGGTVDIVVDGNGLSGGTAGNWNTTLLNWDAGASPHVAWNNANNDTAVLGRTGVAVGTVTLTAPITVGGELTFYATGFTLAASTHGLTFSATDNSILLFGNNGTTAAATITGLVGGGGNVILTSANPFVAGTVTFSGASAGGWSGTTTIDSNTKLTTVSASGRLNKVLGSTSGITLNGGTIQFTRATDADIDAINNSASITVNGGGTFSSTPDAGGASAIENIGAVTLNAGPLNFVFAASAASGQQVVMPSLNRVGSSAAITFSAPASLGTLNKFTVTGAGTTTSGQIIGPWATAGTSAEAQTDYAVYSSDTVAAAGAALTAPGESGWGGTTTAYQFGGATTLTATRTAAGLRYTGALAALDLGASTYTLETYGLLNGGSGVLTVSTTGTGGLTTPSGGGNLYLTPGSSTAGITVTAPIVNNGGNVTLVKSGAGTLTVSSGSNNFAGGTVINAGTMVFSTIASWGGADKNVTFNGSDTLTSTVAGYTGGTLTVNQGATAIITAPGFSFATTTGSGNLILQPSQTTFFNIGDASGFTGNLQAKLFGNISQNGGISIQFSSLADTPGSFLQFAGGQSDSKQTLNITLNGSAPLVFNNRRVQMLPRTASNWIASDSILANNSGNAVNTWIINTDLDGEYTASTVGSTRNLLLSGSNAGNNAFNGLLSDGNSGTTLLSLQKAGTGKWIVSGNNTFSGSVTVSAGTLVLSGTNVYAGTTTVSGGTLVLIGEACILDTGIRNITSGNVEIEAREQIGELQLGGVKQNDGIWGATGNSMATYTDVSLTGAGLLYVNTPFPPSGTVLIVK